MKRDPGIGWLAAAILGSLLVPGCRGGGSQSDAPIGYPVRVVCTTGQVADMLRTIGGEHVTVQSLMASGVDPHLYKATPGDVRKLNAAEMIFYSGLHLEGRLTGLLEKLGRRKRVYAVTDGLHEQHEPLLRKLPGSEGNPDPHVWFDVSLWAKCVDYAAEKLAAADPDHAEDYRRNAQAYMSRLAALHRWCKDQLAQVDKPRRVMVTAHDAFGYLGRAYDVEVHGLQGISTTDEADLATVNKLVDLLVSRKIKAVFVESSVPAKHVRSVVEACAARGHEVSLGRELYSDAMGADGTAEGTYVGMVEYNIRAVVEALK